MQAEKCMNIYFVQLELLDNTRTISIISGSWFPVHESYMWYNNHVSSRDACKCPMYIIVYFVVKTHDKTRLILVEDKPC